MLLRSIRRRWIDLTKGALQLYLLYFNAKKKQTVIVVVARNVADPIGAQEHVGMTHVNGSLAVLLLRLQLSINRDVLNADTTSRRYASWFQVKNNTVLLLLQFPQQYSANYYLDFISKSIGIPQNAVKFERHIHIGTWCTHFIGLYIATWYFKCSLSAHRFDLIAKAVCAIVLDQKSFMQSMSYARERTLFPWHFHWHKFSR